MWFKEHFFKPAYFKTRLILFCSWHDRAAKTFCFLTLACQRFVTTRDRAFALRLPAWIFRGWERLLTLGLGCAMRISFCPHDILKTVYWCSWSFSPWLSPRAVSGTMHAIPSPSSVGWLASCLIPATYIHAGSLQSFLLAVNSGWNSCPRPLLGTGRGTPCAHADGLQHAGDSHWDQDQVGREEELLASQELWPVCL